jgi:hypothetical protein
MGSARLHRLSTPLQKAPRTVGRRVDATKGLIFKSRKAALRFLRCPRICRTSAATTDSMTEPACSRHASARPDEAVAWLVENLGADPSLRGSVYRPSPYCRSVGITPAVSGRLSIDPRRPAHCRCRCREPVFAPFVAWSPSVDIHFVDPLSRQRAADRLVSYCAVGASILGPCARGSPFEVPAREEARSINRKATSRISVVWRWT